MSNRIHGPSVIVLGNTGSEYAPVPFDHQAHVTMGEMGKGCETCHHFTSENSITPCHDCHAEPKTFGQPGLKGAYHRQCLGCHSEWSHSNDCSKCHADNAGTTEAASMELRAQHTEVTTPVKLVYEVSHTPGQKVTFYHDAHAGEFGLKCTKCHHQEECRYCHDTKVSSALKKSEEEIHAICNDCHESDNCDMCHGEEEKPPFTHDAAHWRLGTYHRHLECKSCHQTGARITRLSADCNTCHSDWSSDNFQHSATGFELDETHADLDCEDCHANRRFHDGPDCSGCHDDGRSIATNPPGTRKNIISSSASSSSNK